MSFISLIIYGYYFIKNEIPNEIKIVANNNQDFDFNLPVDGYLYKESIEALDIGESNIPKNNIHLSFQEPFILKGSNLGSYVIECKLFGLIDLKSVKVDVIKQQRLIPSGMSIGIYIETDGVLVIGTGTLTGIDGMNYEPAYGLVKSGDYIVSVNEEKVENKKELIHKIGLSKGEKLKLKIRRDKEFFDVSISPIETLPEEYKLGIWVRDNTQGIGTLTFMDEDKNFGALGHGVNDVDTSTLMEINEGVLYETEIISIIKGEKGYPGELTGLIDYSDESILGEIEKNTTVGIFGKGNPLLTEMAGQEGLEIGLKQEIKTGAAKIRCCVDGTIKDYDIVINKVDINSENINKGIVFTVTDETLLAITGGIVQGMSGSPIIQNNQIVGAVTHVFVQDSTKGYGIFIENMLNTND